MSHIGGSQKSGLTEAATLQFLIGFFFLLKKYIKLFKENYSAEQVWLQAQ